MNEGCSQSNAQSQGSPRFNFDRNPWSPAPANDENVPLSFSPFSFEGKGRLLGLNFNSSPKERRSEKECSPGWEDRPLVTLSPLESERKFKPKLNPLVFQRKQERERAVQQLEREADLESLFHRGSPLQPPHFQEDEGKESFGFGCESTVFESNLKSDRQKPRPCDPQLPEGSLTFSDSEDDVSRGGLKAGKGKPALDLPVKKLVKMAPLCNFFVQFYNGGDTKPVFDLQNQYELAIVRSLLRLMGLKGAGSLPLEPHHLQMSLLTSWKTPQRSRNLLALVFRMAAKVLRIRYTYANNLNGLAVSEVKRRFVRHYFQDAFATVPGLADLDLESHRVLSRLNKDHMAALLSAPDFQQPFHLFVEAELCSFLNAYRTRKLTKLFAKMEELFLSSRSEDEALRQILKWVDAGKVHWVSPTPAYLQAIAACRRR